MIYVMRGVPGSGKSFHAKSLTSDFERVVTCSADLFFMDKDGRYDFNPALLPKAHGACLRAFLDAVQNYVPNTAIVVDNTNTTVEEMAPYIAIASAYEHPVILATVLCDVNVAHSRNTHGVPLHAVVRMDATLRSSKLPPFWNIETRIIEN